MKRSALSLTQASEYAYRFEDVHGLSDEVSKGSIWVDRLLWHTLRLELVGQVLLTVPQDAVALTRHALLQTSALVCRGRKAVKKALRRRQEINGINRTPQLGKYE